MHFKVSLINSVRIVLKSGQTVVYSLPCDRQGELFMKWDTSVCEEFVDRKGFDERRVAIEKSPQEGYFSSREQRVPRRFHYIFYSQLRKIYNIKSWFVEDIKTMRTCWCYVVKPKSSRLRRVRRVAKKVI